MVYLEDGFDTMREINVDKTVSNDPGDTGVKNGRVKDIILMGITFLIIIK